MRDPFAGLVFILGLLMGGLAGAALVTPQAIKPAPTPLPIQLEVGTSVHPCGLVRIAVPRDVQMQLQDEKDTMALYFSNTQTRAMSIKCVLPR